MVAMDFWRLMAAFDRESSNSSSILDGLLEGLNLAALTKRPSNLSLYRGSSNLSPYPRWGLTASLALCPLRGGDYEPVTLSAVETESR